jgi:hypothetical protein
MIDPDCLRAIPWFAELARSHPRLEDSIAGLILLLPGYFVELGFYGLVLAVALRAVRQLQLDEATRTLVALACAGLLVSTFLRSTVIANNDFGIRSILIAQFFLLLLAVRWGEGAFGVVNRSLHVAMLAMVWIGLAGTVYQVAGLRLYLPLEDRLGRPDEAGLAERAMAWRHGFDTMDARIPKGAVIQFDTAQPSDYFRYAQLMQAGRQMATAFPQCASVFGGDVSACPGIEQGAARLFSLKAGAALSATEAQAECSRFAIDDLVATRWDAVWLDSKGWVWKLPAVLDTGDLRVLNCVAAAN